MALKNKIFFYILFFLFSSSVAIDQYYVTAFDSSYFNRGLNLVRSINLNNGKKVKKILIFDLGLNNHQKSLLLNNSNVSVCAISDASLTRKYLTSRWGRKVPGWFAWKPLIIKEALDKFPYVLYLDAGSEVLRPLDVVFDCISQQGYFLIEGGEKSFLKNRSTKFVVRNIINKFDFITQDKLFKLPNIVAGIQGVSKRYLSGYIMPVFNLVKDLRYFKDDGSSRLGFGYGRHDQVLFTIFACFQNFNFFSKGWNSVELNGKSLKFHIHWNRKELNLYSLLKY